MNITSSTIDIVEQAVGLTEALADHGPADLSEDAVRALAELTRALHAILG